MGYGKPSYIKFYSCYLQQCPSIDLFSYWTPFCGQNGPMNKVCTSFCLKVFLELAFQFFLEFSMVLGIHMVLCMTELHFLKIIFLPLKWGKYRPMLGFFECVGKFSYQFFSQFGL